MMMKKKNQNRYFLLLMLMATALPVFSQEGADTVKTWKISGNGALSFSQVSLTNWAEGGDGSVSGTFLFGLNANMKKSKHYWDNSLAVEYGLVKNESQGLRKSVDKLNFTSKYGYDIGKKWFFSFLYDFKTQFDKGYNYPNTDEYISKIMAPGYMNLALGFDYKPNENLSLFLSPLGSKFTFVLDDYLSSQGTFGVEPGDKFRAEMGALAKFAYLKKSLITNVDFETKLELFSSYTDSPLNIDVNWDARFNMKINKYLSANLGATLRYDNDVKFVDSEGVTHGPKTQLKQLLGIGLAYSF